VAAIDELEAAIAANPDDHAALDVHADALLAAGDARGELGAARATIPSSRPLRFDVAVPRFDACQE
jgi:hypothetical protein